MNSLLVQRTTSLAFVGLSLLGCAEAVEAPIETKEQEVRNGFLWQEAGVVMIRNATTGGSCSGAMLNNETIVTAAHCVQAVAQDSPYYSSGPWTEAAPYVFHREGQFKIGYWKGNLNSCITNTDKAWTEPGGGNMSAVLNSSGCKPAAFDVYVPSRYFPLPFEEGTDIAVIRLKEGTFWDVDSSDYVALSRGGEGTLETYSRYIHGYGYNSETGGFGYLRAGAVTVLWEGPKRVTTGNEADTCRGDSGGPLLSAETRYPNKKVLSAVHGVGRKYENTKCSTHGAWMVASGQATPLLEAAGVYCHEVSSGSAVYADCEHRWGQGTWTEWEDLGQTAYGATPGVSVRHDGQIDFVIFGSSGNYVNKVGHVDGSWWWPSSGFANFSGTQHVRTPVVLHTRGEDWFHVFGHAPDGTLETNHWSPNTWQWSGWQPMAGESPELGVSVTSWGPGRMDMIAKGSDGKNLHRYNNGGGWSSWHHIGGTTPARPNIHAWGHGHLDLIAIGWDNKAYNKVYDGGWWPSYQGWESLGAQKFHRAPILTSPGPGQLDAIGVGTDGRAYNKVWQGGWWPSQTEWADLGADGYTLEGDVSAAWSSGDRLDLVVKGRTNGFGGEYHLLYKYWTPSAGWSPAQTEWHVMAKGVSGEPVVVSDGQGGADIFATFGTQLRHIRRN